jgi:hypothetical protein
MSGRRVSSARRPTGPILDFGFLIFALKQTGRSLGSPESKIENQK